jgi:hypothetical protein
MDGAARAGLQTILIETKKEGRHAQRPSFYRRRSIVLLLTILIGTLIGPFPLSAEEKSAFFSGRAIRPVNLP